MEKQRATILIHKIITAEIKTYKNTQRRAYYSAPYQHLMRQFIKPYTQH